MKFVATVVVLAIMSALVVGFAISLQHGSQRLDRALAATFSHPKQDDTKPLLDHPKPLQAGAGLGVPEP
jgi:hypothetical protein